MHLGWSKHLKGEQKDNFEALVKNSSAVLLRLRDIIDEELANLEKSESTLDDFESSAWAYKQAYRNGDRAGLLKIRNYLNG